MEMTSVLCDAFRTRSRAAWRLIRRGQSAGVRAAEETITNLILLELSLLRARAAGLVVRSFSKAQEASVGADWEMWLGGQTASWLGLRIQAKAVDLRSLEFPHLHYRTKGAPLFQSDTLIRSALTGSPPRLPLYVLYTYAPRAVLTAWPCSSYRRESGLFGCSLVSAFQVRALRLAGGKRLLSDLSAHMYPWHCLVCCRGYADGSLPERTAGYLTATLIAADKDGSVVAGSGGEGTLDEEELARLMKSYRRPRLSERPPEYVLSLLAGRDPDLPADVFAVLVMQQSEVSGRGHQ